MARDGLRLRAAVAWTVAKPRACPPLSMRERVGGIKACGPYAAIKMNAVSR
jgi:hypothetical protein